ncbi:MAG TPA: ATP-binding protein [Polyangia bacterium]|nr:ATP-binding protein [Polyangia bacterium]
MRFHAPANVFLRRAQLILMVAAIVPTILLTALGIILLAIHSNRGVAIVAGVLVLTLCTTSLVGYILGSVFVRRGASLAKVQTDFLSSVSHELRTPITSIRMFIETLRDQRVTDPAAQHEILCLLHREMVRLDGLVGKLIELSRIEDGRVPFERAPVAVADVVAEALAAFETVKLGTRVDLDVTLEPGLEVMGDQSALAQALANLLTNAWKYTADNKKISLHARAIGKQVSITVTDNGPGIPSHEQKRIFEKFERGRAAVDGRESGSGLGLAIVRAIVQAHRGHVELDTAVSAGACFRISLPRHARATAGAATATG